MRIVELAVAAEEKAAFRDRFSRQRLFRRSSTLNSSVAGVTPLASAGLITGVLADDGAGAGTAVLELIQTASPLRDHCEPSNLVVM